MPGGFDSILTLFDASGDFLTENDEGAGVAIDPSTGEAFDARITTNLAAGNYIVALTQYDSFANGNNLSEGFAEDGHPNFTADPAFATGGPVQAICSAIFPEPQGAAATETGPSIS